MKLNRHVAMHLLSVLATAMCICSWHAIALADDDDDDFDSFIVPDDPAEAARWFEKGKALAAANHAEEARLAFRQARRTHPTPQYAANLGTVELAMKRYREAARHLDEALAGLDTKVDPARVKAVQEARDAAKAEIGTIKIVAPAGATIWLEGAHDHSLGAAPIEGVLYVNPGHVALRAEQDRAIGRAEVDVGKGETREVVLAFSVPKVETAPLPVVATRAPESARAGDEKSRALVASGITITAAAAVGGTVMTIMAASKHHEGNSLKSAIQAQGINCASDGCPDVDAAYASRDAFAAVAVVSYAIGALAAGGTLAYAFWPAQKKVSQARNNVTVVPAASRNELGFLVHGTW